MRPIVLVFSRHVGLILLAVAATSSIAFAQIADDERAHANAGLQTIGHTLAFAALMLTVGRWLLHRVLHPRNAWAVGFAMNARRDGDHPRLLALQAGIIREPLFVALVLIGFKHGVPTVLLARL